MKQLLSILLLLPFLFVDVCRAGQRAEGEIETRRARLQAHADVFGDWIKRNSHLSDEELRSLLDLLNQSVQREQDRWKLRGALPGNHSIVDYGPTTFTTPLGSASSVNARELRPKLTERLTAENRSRVSQALNEREQATSTAIADYMISLIDWEVSLSPSQRARFRSVLPAQADWLKLWCDHRETTIVVMFGRQEFLTTAALDRLVRGVPDDLLTAAQREMVNKMTSPARRDSLGSQVLIHSKDGPEGWAKSLDAAIERDRKRLAEAAATRIARLTDILSLTEAQQRYLTVAGAGAAQQCLAAWKAETLPNLDRIAQHNADPRLGQEGFTLRLLLPSTSCIDKNELWLHAVNTVKDSDVQQGRTAFRRKALVAYLTALLDRELWLTPDQRESFQRLVNDVLPQTAEMDARGPRGAAVRIIPLFRISDDDLAGVLTESQQEAWKQLQGQYERVDGGFVVRISGGRGETLELPP